ncbi:MAG: WD40 repeat domain-containing protein [Gammaproteobacteria bacterium]
MKLKLLLTILCVAFLGAACDRTQNAEKTVLMAPDGVFSGAITEHYTLIGTTSGPAELWRLKPKSLIHTWQHTEANNGVINVAISANEQYAITAERDSLAWWRIDDGTLLNVWSLPHINAVSLSSDGQFALVGLKDKAIYFALPYGKTLYAFPHDKSVLATSLSMNGQLALTGSEDNTAKLWDLTTGKLIHHWPHSNKLATVALSDDGRYAMTNAALSQARLWITATGKPYKSIGPRLLTLSAARFSANGKYLATGRTSQRIDLWDIKTGKLVKYWRPQKEQNWRPSAATILALAFTENDRKIMSLAANGYLQRWRR